MVFLLSSCMNKQEPLPKLESTPVTKTVVKTDTQEVPDYWNEKFQEQIEEQIEHKDYSWKDEEFEKQVHKKEEITPLSEQYCIAKWWKVETKIIAGKEIKNCISEFWETCSIEFFYINEWCVKMPEKSISSKTQEQKNDSTLTFSLEEKSQTGSEQNDEEIINQNIILNTQVGKSGTYYIVFDPDWISYFQVRRNDGAIKTIFWWVENIEITDYELMLNKQVKVMYIEADESLEKVIDLTNILTN